MGDDRLIRSQIGQCEERLRQAMLQSDVPTLDELLAPELLFTNHLGQLMTKQDDLRAHQAGLLVISEIALSDQRIQVCDSIVVVSVQAHISGSFGGTVSEGEFRFTRVWHRSVSNAWQIVAGHSSVVA